MNIELLRNIHAVSSYEEARWVLFGAPYDGTTSFRPGTRFGPPALRQDSWGQETWSPYQDKDTEDLHVCDIGDLELPFGNPRPVLDQLTAHFKEIWGAGKKPIMIGGEHLLTQAAIDAALDFYPDLHIVHLDAHTDLRHDYLGQELSHAAVIYHSYELMSERAGKAATGRIHSFGIRSGLKEEFEFARKELDFHPFDLLGMENLGATIPAGAPVYLTLDLDVLDPAVFPGTGTPEPGGVNFRELLAGLFAAQGLNIIGFDLMELSPHYDQSGASNAVAAKALREMLLLFCD